MGFELLLAIAALPTASCLRAGPLGGRACVWSVEIAQRRSGQLTPAVVHAPDVLAQAVHAMGAVPTIGRDGIREAGCAELTLPDDRHGFWVCDVCVNVL